MFSDGITEAMNEADEQFGYPRLSKTLAESDGTPSGVMSSVLAAIREHAGAAAQSDDLTLVCFGRSSDWAEEEEADKPSEAPADEDGVEDIGEVVLLDEE